MKFGEIIHARKEQKWKGSLFEKRADTALRRPPNVALEEMRRHEEADRVEEAAALAFYFRAWGAYLCSDCCYDPEGTESICDPLKLEGERCTDGCGRVFQNGEWVGDLE